MTLPVSEKRSMECITYYLVEKKRRPEADVSD